MVRTSLTIVAIALATLFGCTNDLELSLQQNEATARRLVEEGINQQNAIVWDELLAENYVQHCQAMPPDLREIYGVPTMKQYLREHFIAFLDWQEKIELLLSDSGYVTLVTTATGTQTAPMGVVPATNKPVEITKVTVHRFNDEGKIAESWVSYDNLTMLMQLGLVQ